MFNRFHLLIATLLLAVMLPSRAGPAAPYRIISGDLRPFTTETGKEAPGALGALVNVLAIRVGDASPIQFYPWARALAMTSSQPRTLILPLTRTPEREAKYSWLVKLYRQQFVFLALRSNGLDIGSIDNLRDLRIAVLRGSPNVAHLESRGFKHIFAESTVSDMARLLERGMVDAIYGGDVINLKVLSEQGIARDAIKISEPLDYADIWLGGSLDFTDADAALWQGAMKQLVQDGVYLRILTKYGLPQ